MKAVLATLAAAGLAAAGLAAAASGHSSSGSHAKIQVDQGLYQQLRSQARPLRVAVPSRTSAGSQTYNDTTGDAVNGAPDIGSVTAANDDAGNITFDVAFFGGNASLQSNEGVVIVMDTDRNASTGSGGFDYLFVGVKDHFGLLVWNGSSFVFSTAASAHATEAPHHVMFAVNRADLGNTTAINFYLETTRDNLQTIGDDAPNGTGVYTYSLILPSAPTTTTTPLPPPPAPAPKFVVTPVGVPHAGKRFVVRARVVIGSLSALPSALGCAAKIGTSPVRTSVLNGPAPYRQCVATVPVRTTGKTLTVTLLMQYKSTGATRKLAFRIQ